MQTERHTREWRRSRTARADAITRHRNSEHGDISPVWEVLPQGHEEIGPRKSVLRRDSMLRRGLALADVLAALVLLVLTVSFIDPGQVGLRVIDLLVVPFVLLVGKVIGLYDRDQNVLRKTTMDEAPSIFYLAVVYALAAWFCETVLFRGYLARPQVLVLLAGTFLGITAGRLVVRRAARALATRERCIVIGTAADAARIAAKFDGADSVNADVIGWIAMHGAHEGDEHRSGKVPRLGDYGQLTRVVAAHHVERVIIAPHTDGQEEILDAIRLVKALGVKVSVVPRLLEVLGSSSTVDEINGIWLLGVRHFGLVRSSELLKRAVDVLITGVAVLLLGPLLIMLAVAVKLDSDGPVFFRQPRIGRSGRTFWMLKFRSMVDDAEAGKDELRTRNEAVGGLFKIEDDPRITRVGKLLRTTSLDELPQLLNVLKGDMSLVGPRPLVPDEDRLIEGWRRRRLAVKPGMTGLWQIFGSSRIPMQEMVKIDYIYGANWSLWLDLRILLRTVPYVLSRRGQ